jgi:hypothetical protein
MPNASQVLLAWDQIPVRAITIFSPFPPLFSFFCHIQMFFNTNMNIFITLLENVNKSRTSANSLSLIKAQSVLFREIKLCIELLLLHDIIVL